jgi:hypothetical protein
LRPGSIHELRVGGVRPCECITLGNDVGYETEFAISERQQAVLGSSRLTVEAVEVCLNLDPQFVSLMLTRYTDLQHRYEERVGES